MNEELILVNVALANKLFAAGVELLENRYVDGNLCFVFKVEDSKRAIIEKVMRGN